MIELRPYQSELVNEVRSAFRARRRVLLVLSTGGGKTVIFAYVVSRAAGLGNSVMIVAHRIEIVEQISRALDAMGVRHGRIVPGHNQTDDTVQVAMVQTLSRRIATVRPPSLLVIDEAHHAAVGSWDAVAAAWPAAKVLGVTATPRRLDGRSLGTAFDAMVQGPSMRQLINMGFLADYDYLAPPQKIDLDSVKTRMGDYAIDELASVMDKSTITGDAVEHYRTHLHNRPAIAFCCTVEHAKHVAQQFRDAGYSAASVDGAMDKAARKDLIASIGDGRLNVLTSCNLISEGTDIPAVAGALLLRPTQSVAMHLQMVGRCLRPKSDGGRAIILDHTGNVHRHGLPDTDHKWTLEPQKKKKTKPPEVMTCEQCFRAFAIAPGWRDAAECRDEHPAGCILNTPPTARELPAQVGGQLLKFDVQPAWAGGINIALARGKEYEALLDLADTAERLRHIATVRGNKPRWVSIVLRERGLRAARHQIRAGQRRVA